MRLGNGLATMSTFLLLGACAPASNSTAPTPPTSVAPAVAEIAEAPESLALADDMSVTEESGFWAQVEANDQLADCLRAGANSDATRTTELESDLAAIGTSGKAIIADCLSGA